MTVSSHPLARGAIGRLLCLLRSPAETTRLPPGAWDDIVRLARHTRLLGVLAYRIAAIGALKDVPAQPRGHLEAATKVARYRAHTVRAELRALSSALEGTNFPVVLLKGSAYVEQGLPIASGRLPGDVDIMVPRTELDGTERKLLAAGWESQVSDDYDQRYYREWSHELPPLRYPGHPLEVDLHHTITPITGRLQPDPALLFASAIVPVDGSRWRVLSPGDQVLHMAVHLFQDSDLAARLHELVDFDGLLRHYATTPGFWSSLRSRAAALGLERPLWYALHFSAELLGTPGTILADLPAPSAPFRAAMTWMTTQALPPTHPDEPPSMGSRTARLLALMRYHWLRMPPRLLLAHLSRKAARSLVSKIRGAKGRV